MATIYSEFTWIIITILNEHYNLFFPLTIIMESKKEYDLTSIKQQIPSILDDFTKYYIFYNKNPEYDEYQRLYYNIKDNMDNLESQVKKTSQSIDEETVKLNEILKTVNEKIAKERNKNKQLKRRLGLAENESNGADEMVKDYTTVYDTGYTRNWSLVIGIVGLLVYGVNLYSTGGSNVQKAVMDAKNITTASFATASTLIGTTDVQKAQQDLDAARTANLKAGDVYDKLRKSSSTDEVLKTQARAAYTRTQQDLVKARNALTDATRKQQAK
jgi:hypothetical protein